MDPVSYTHLRLKQQAGKVIAKFMQMGEMHAINDVIDFDTASLLAEEFHAKVEHEVHVTIEERLFTQEEDSQEDLVGVRFRVYDDGVVLRYEFPQKGNLKDLYKRQVLYPT